MENLWYIHRRGCFSATKRNRLIGTKTYVWTWRTLCCAKDTRHKKVHSMVSFMSHFRKAQLVYHERKPICACLWIGKALTGIGNMNELARVMGRSYIFPRVIVVLVNRSICKVCLNRTVKELKSIHSYWSLYCKCNMGRGQRHFCHELGK